MHSQKMSQERYYNMSKRSARKKTSKKNTAIKVSPRPVESSVEVLPLVGAGAPSGVETAVEVLETQPVEVSPSLDDVGVAEEKPGEHREVVRSASLVMLGNLSSSLMGMVRQIMVSSTGTAISGPFFAALSPAQKFNDLLVNGSVQGALIPTFNDYAAPEKAEELRRLIFTLINLILLIMAGASILFFFFAPWVVSHTEARGFTAPQKLLAIHFAQIIFFSLLALGPFAILQASLYARKEFGWPALAPVAYHVGIIIGAAFTSIVGAHFYGQYGLGFGVILGALGEIALLMPGVRKQRFRYMLVLDLKHPAIRHILRLYAPIAFSFFVSAAFAIFDASLASLTPCASFMASLRNCGSANLSAMQFATTLVQFPVGLVASALGFAVLPTLTAYMREGEIERFKDMLQLGFRLGLLLMIPAAAGLVVLRLPIVSLIFQHGKFTPQDAMLGAIALQNYAFQLPFVAIDQLLISAFYARKNTIVPVVVLVISELGYLAVALPFWQTVGMPALPLANTTQISCHALVLLIWLRIVIGPMHLSKLAPALLKILLATAIMVALAWGLQTVFAQVSLFSLHTLTGRLLTVIIVGSISAATYFGVVMILKVEEVGLLKGAVMAKLGKK
jgi:putative peptidoglycan lipid II flippase